MYISVLWSNYFSSRVIASRILATPYKTSHWQSFLIDSCSKIQNRRKQVNVTTIVPLLVPLVMLDCPFFCVRSWRLCHAGERCCVIEANNYTIWMTNYMILIHNCTTLIFDCITIVYDCKTTVDINSMLLGYPVCYYSFLSISLAYVYVLRALGDLK